MRGYGQRIDVQVDEQGQPQGFIWRGRRYRVAQVLERWRERVPWWRMPDGSCEVERSIWRLVAAPGTTPYSGVFEIAQGTQGWILLRLSD